jgi:histidyl-tRNA synthetase
MLEHLEYYSRGLAQQIHVRHQLGLDSPTSDDGERNDGAALADALAGLSPEAARDVVNGLLRQMGVDLASNTRTPDEIIERVLDKAQRHAALRSGARRESLERALQFCSSLTELRGEPHLVLREAEQLLRSYDVPLSALDELGEVVKLFQEHGLPNVRITLAPGMARGIAYYSGLIFELYAEPTGTSGEFTELQICGGGRYDSLPLAITGRHSFPALGFAFGLERLSHCIPADAIKGAEVHRVAIVVDNRHARKAGLVLAARLRRAGFAAVLHTPKATDSRLREQLVRAGYAAMVQMQSGGAVQIGSPNANEGSIVLLDHGLSTDEIAALGVAVREVPMKIANEVLPVAAIGGAT